MVLTLTLTLSLVRVVRVVRVGRVGSKWVVPMLCLSMDILAAAASLDTAESIE